MLLGAAGCRKAADEGEAPPPVAPARAGVCDGGGGSTRFDAEIFLRTLGDYCLDPHGEARSYGASLPGSLDDVCVELFNGECEVYKRFGLDRVTTLRYVDGKTVDGRGSNASVSVTLSRFSRRTGAYGFFTKRVLGDGDPLQVTVQPLEAGSAGALGGGVAYVWQGRHVLELTYVSEEEAPEQLRASSAEVLPVIARGLAERIPGEAGHLAEVELLPAEHRVPLGVRYEAEKVLGVAGAGSGAVAHHRQGDRRWRTLVAIREDEQSANDLLHTLSHAGKGWPTPFKQRRAVRVRFAPEEDQKARVWVLARRGSMVVGVGDDAFSAPQLVEAVLAGAPLPEAVPDPDLDEQKKLELLTELATRAERSSAAKPAPGSATEM